MAGPVLDLGLQGGRWQLYQDLPLPPPVGVAVEGNGGDALRARDESPSPTVHPTLRRPIYQVLSTLPHDFVGGKFKSKF
jgi:hypothetical protein